VGQFAAPQGLLWAEGSAVYREQAARYGYIDVPASTVLQPQLLSYARRGCGLKLKPPRTRRCPLAMQT
jgi:hypothetical protein